MARRRETSTFENTPLWYKDAVIYEAHVRAFYDGNGDGVGDFAGLTLKLNYLQDLGVTAVWVLPFFPSPWKDDGYDIADYTSVHPAYGTLRDFQVFLREAHRRGLHVITELVLNHTSDQHEWFQKSRRAKPGARWRDFYVWTDDPQKYKEARIIFKDFEPSNWTWDSEAQAYFWHRFYSHQPDLNFDSPHVRRAVLKALDFWLDMGVDGLRLDAVPYLFEREGTTCENLPETHEFLKQVREHIDANYPNRLLLAEANQWPEDATAYFGDGDECHMAFHFPLMPRLFMAARMEDRHPVIDILDQTPEIPDSCQWAIFLRNHDELTLEMVTDEERDYMYRAYAGNPQMRINLGIRRRLAPLLGNQRRLVELMNGLLLSLPGTPVIYYGDEIGMGDNIYLGDRNGVRTPMQWNGDRNAGFSAVSPQRLYLPVNMDPEFQYEAVNVETQQQNPHSLLWWMRRMIGLRKQSLALSRGKIRFFDPENRRVLAFVREHEDERVLVIANLSRFPQPVELDLAEFQGFEPIEMSGRISFPPIGELPYFITLAPHGFYWFSLEPVKHEAEWATAASIERIPVAAVSDWAALFAGKNRTAIERALPAFLKTQRWFRGGSRTVRAATIAEVVPLANNSAYCLFADVDYSEGDGERYFLMFSVASNGDAHEIWQRTPETVAIRLTGPGGEQGVLYQSLRQEETHDQLLGMIARRRRLKGEEGELVSVRAPYFRRLSTATDEESGSRLLRAEHSNTSVAYGHSMILKLFRKLEEGTNPELEIGRHLTDRVGFEHTPPVAGWLEYRRRGAEPVTIGILKGFVESYRDAWEYAQDNLARYFERVMMTGTTLAEPPPLDRHPLDVIDSGLPTDSAALFEHFLEDARLLGQRTAEMHLALAVDKGAPEFKPEPFTDFYRQGIYHGMLALKNRTLKQLGQRLRQVPPAAREEARALLASDRKTTQAFRPIRDMRIAGARIRHHGDYHLGQVLWTGRDFFIIDFEGEPARPLSERKLKRSALRDLAAMLRSLHYAPYAALIEGSHQVLAREHDLPTLEKWAEFWYLATAARFLSSYLETARGASFLPGNPGHFRILLNAYLLERALEELGREIDDRPEWVHVPIRQILDLIGSGPQTDA